MLFLQQIEFMQSPVRISSCLTSQGAEQDENGKLSALRNPAEQIRSFARLHSPLPHPHVRLLKSPLDSSSRSLSAISTQDSSHLTTLW